VPGELLRSAGNLERQGTVAGDEWLVATKETQRNRARPAIIRVGLSPTARTAKNSLFRIWSQQEDLPNPAFLPQHMCFSRIAQRHPATNRQNELAIAHVVGKLAHLGCIRPSTHTRDLHCRILGRRTFRQHSGVAKGAVLLYPRDQLGCDITTNGVRNRIPEPQIGGNTVLIGAAAASVNPIDWKLRSGAIPLFIL